MKCRNNLVSVEVVSYYGTITSYPAGNDSHRMLIEDNVVWGSGANPANTGIRVYYSDDVIVRRNVVWAFGYGIRIDDCQGTNLIENNTLTGCSSSGVYVYQYNSSDTQIRNSIITDNPRGIYFASPDIPPYSSYNCFYNNTVTYEGTIYNKTGDIYVDPKFIDAANNDYHLLADSPCIDSGTPAGRDMGAYQFEAPSAPIISVLKPTSGDALTGEASYDIKWSIIAAAGLKPNTVVLDYATDGGIVWTSIATGQANSGTHAWNVPGLDISLGKIRIAATDNYEQVGNGQNSGTFYIDSSTPEVVLTAPVTGETITAENTYSIQYTASDTVGLGSGAIDLYYSTVEGTWISIASGQDNSGSYAWTTPRLDSATVRVSVEVEDRVGNKARAASGDFTLEVPRDTTQPLISIQIKDVPLKQGDYIAASPLIKAVASDEGTVVSVQIYLDGEARTTD
ncbi:NosD domain-containing protein, partial [Candidatus Margulisiibacteriota bacterium]